MKDRVTLKIGVMAVITFQNITVLLNFYQINSLGKYKRLLSKTFIDITNPNPFEQKCIIIVLVIEVDSFLYPPLPGDHLLSQQTTNLKTS